MNFNKITKYNNCDILIRWNYNEIQDKGFDKNKTLGEMINLALENNCKIIIKSGYRGKWYLKGKDKSVDFLQSKIIENLGKSRDGVCCYLIE
jgi:hypothetical protein